MFVTQTFNGAVYNALLLVATGERMDYDSKKLKTAIDVLDNGFRDGRLRQREEMLVDAEHFQYRLLILS